MNETYQPGTLAPLVPASSGPQGSKKGLWIGLGIGVIFLCCLAAVVVIYIGRNQLPAVTRLFATSTPIPTSTPLATSTHTPIPPTATPKSFILTDPAFEASYKDTCVTNIQITEVDGTSLSVSGDISMKNGKFVIWCYGAKHTWIGTLTYAGYTFTSDGGDPLQFIIDQNRGYVYIGGKGSVTSPDGSVVNLP